MSGNKKIKVIAAGKEFTIIFKDTKPKNTQVFDNENREYVRKAKSLLRIKAKEVGLSKEENGKLYGKTGNELITNEYFRRIYKHLK